MSNGMVHTMFRLGYVFIQCERMVEAESVYQHSRGYVEES